MSTPGGSSWSPPCLCGGGASGLGSSSHVQLTAVEATRPRRPPHGFLFDSGPPLGWLLPCLQSSKGPVGSSEKGGGGWGRVNGTCTLFVLLPMTFTSNSQDVLPFLVASCRHETVCPNWEFVFQRFRWLGSRRGTRERKPVFVELLPSTRCAIPGAGLDPEKLDCRAKRRASACGSSPREPHYVNINTH